MDRITQLIVLLVGMVPQALIEIIWDINGRPARLPHPWFAIFDVLCLLWWLFLAWCVYQQKAPAHTDAEDLA